MDIYDAARPFRDAFTYDPGHSDLDDEQPISISVTLGDWRRLDMEMIGELPPRFHLNQEPLDFAASVTLLRKARTDLMLALALLRELNDALKIPGWLQPRVDAVLDRAEQS